MKSELIHNKTKVTAVDQCHMFLGRGVKIWQNRCLVSDGPTVGDKIWGILNVAAASESKCELECEIKVWEEKLILKLKGDQWSQHNYP